MTGTVCVEKNTQSRNMLSLFKLIYYWHDYLEVTGRFHEGSSQLLAEKYPQLPDPCNAGEGK